MPVEQRAGTGVVAVDRMGEKSPEARRHWPDLSGDDSEQPAPALGGVGLIPLNELRGVGLYGGGRRADLSGDVVAPLLCQDQLAKDGGVGPVRSCCCHIRQQRQISGQPVLLRQETAQQDEASEVPFGEEHVAPRERPADVAIVSRMHAVNGVAWPLESGRHVGRLQSPVPASDAPAGLPAGTPISVGTGRSRSAPRPLDGSERAPRRPSCP